MGLLTATKQDHAGGTTKLAGTVAHLQPAPLAEGDDRSLVLFQVFVQSLGPGLALVRRVGIRILVMRVDLKGNQVERLERGGLHDRHVIGGPNGGPGQVGSRTAAHVRDIGLPDLLPQPFHQFQIVQCFQEPKRIAASRKNSCRRLNPGDGIGRMMDRAKGDPDRGKRGLNDRFIMVMVGQCVGNKGDFVTARKMFGDRIATMLEKAGRMDTGAAD